ncbi:unnamed protein product [Trichobilharzia regenti]|nr:unnamed protein product [Trichobilharzia regenti]
MQARPPRQASSVTRPILPWLVTEEDKPKMNENCEVASGNGSNEQQSQVDSCQHSTSGDGDVNEELNKLTIEQSAG